MIKKVSIVIPTYNRGHFITRALNSVLSQNIPDYEIIIVDDRSLDNTQSVIKQYSELHKEVEIRYFLNNGEKGPSAARNVGIKNAKGSFIAFLDSDDEWVPNHLEKSLYYLEKYCTQVDLVTANPLRKNQLTNEVYKEDILHLSEYDYKRIEEGFLFNPKTLFETALTKRIITTQTLVAKSNLIKTTLFDEELIWGEDNMYMLTLATKNIGVLHLQEFHVIYWGHEDNLTNCIGLKDRSENIKAIIGMSSFYRSALTRFASKIKKGSPFRKRVAEYIFWQEGYFCYVNDRLYMLAINSFKEALRIWPYDIKMWKTFLITKIKSHLQH